MFAEKTSGDLTGIYVKFFTEEMFFDVTDFDNPFKQ
jgi:hypothetical protein